jgi:hypothetical protein
MKEVEDTNKWKDILCSCNGRINTVKMFLLLKVTDRFDTIPIKILVTPYRNGENSPEICMEPQKTLNSQRNPEQKYHN